MKYVSIKLYWITNHERKPSLLKNVHHVWFEYVFIGTKIIIILMFKYSRSLLYLFYSWIEILPKKRKTQKYKELKYLIVYLPMQKGTINDARDFYLVVVTFYSKWCYFCEKSKIYIERNKEVLKTLAFLSQMHYISKFKNCHKWKMLFIT